MHLQVCICRQILSSLEAKAWGDTVREGRWVFLHSAFQVSLWSEKWMPHVSQGCSHRSVLPTSTKACCWGNLSYSYSYSIPPLPKLIKSLISCRTDPPFITRLDPQSESIYRVNCSQHGCTVIYLGRTLLCQTLAFARAPRSTMPALIWGASSADQTQTSQLLQRAATSFKLQIDPHTHHITHQNIRLGEHGHIQRRTL